MAYRNLAPSPMLCLSKKFPEKIVFRDSFDLRQSMLVKVGEAVPLRGGDWAPFHLERSEFVDF